MPVVGAPRRSRRLNVLRFIREGDRFLAVQPGQPPVELFALSETAFFPKGADVRMVFDRDKAGAVNRVTLHQSQGDLVGERITPPKGGQEALAKLAGTYYSQEADAELRVEVVGEQLVANVGRNPRFPLLQISDGRLAVPGGGSFEAKRGPDGQVNELVFSSSRLRNLPFVRKP